MDTPVKAAAPRKAALAFIFVTVLLDVLAFGIVIPVLPKLIEAHAGGDTRRAAEIYGVFATAWALMQFVFSPLLGALSDRFGRRPVLLISMAGLGLDYILMALAPNLTWLFVGRVISGITAASFSTATAYIADVTPPEKRAARLRHGRRRVRPRLRGRPGDRRPARHDRPAAAVLGGRGVQPRQRRLRLVRPAGVAAAASGARRSTGRAPTRSARCVCSRSTPSCRPGRRCTSSTSWRT